MGKMGKLYANPPLVEALCEFRFEANQPWDWTIPGLVYDKIKTDFPKKRQQNILQLELRAEQEEVEQTVKGGVARMQFLRADEHAMIQIGPDLLVVNHLRPYPTWQIFSEMIANALITYRQVANPKSVRRIGLRYINRIEIPDPQVLIEDYLLAVPQVPNSVPQVFATWAQRVEIPYEQTGGMLILQSGILRKKEQVGTAFLLDLDFVTLQPASVNLDSAMTWVGQAHDEVEKTFEACVMDKARTLFKEKQDDHK
jgi:uncharacterized protein (TIGR04255 family)